MASNELEDLIRQSANEKPEEAAPEMAELRPPLFRHPAAVLLAWLLLLMTTYSFYQNPLPKQRMVGSRSAETDLSVAMYHAAHRIETYRRATGHLPDYLDPAWQESKKVSYEVTDDGDSYVLTGEVGDLVMTFSPGDNPEHLLHFDQFGNGKSEP